MESRSSVGKIKEKFEKLNSSVHLVNHCEPRAPLNRDGAINQSNNNKCVIKRSHAFRCDKTPVKAVSSVSHTVNEIQCSPLQVGNKAPKPLPRSTPRTVLSDTKNRCVNIKGNPKVGYSTDTLKAVLKAPLPSGPAPKKPPRTFLQTHPNRSHDAEFISKESSGSLSNSTRFQPSLQYALPPRSKTESQIKLKKLEAACLSNTPSNVPAKRSPDQKSRPLSTNPFVINDKKGCNGLKSLPTTHPSPKRNSVDSSCWLEALNSINSNPGYYSLSSAPCHCPVLPSGHKSQPCEHIYSQPYSPRSPRKASSSSLPHRNSKGLFNDSPRSLHYMSCPIRTCPEPTVSHEWSSTTPKNTLIFDELKENNNDVLSKTEKAGSYCVSCNQTIDSPLYDAILLVGLDFLSSEMKKPIIKFKHPSQVEIDGGLLALCFPDAEYWPPTVIYSHNNYTQILTDLNGSRKYAYCHRLQPEETSIVPLVYVILTHHKADLLYYAILSRLEEKHGESETSVKNLIDSFSKRNFPHCLESHESYKDLFDEELVPEVSLERYYDNPLPRFLEIFPIKYFMYLFGCALHERKIILLSNNISRLSDGVGSLVWSMRPFSWVHTVIAVVPTSLTDIILDCPTPYIIGLFKDSFNIRALSSDDGMIICDIDSGSVLRRVGDESQLLPPSLSTFLYMRLHGIVSGDKACSNAFNSFFTTIIQAHRHLFLSHGRKHKSAKIKNPEELRQFLEKFVNTAMFHQYLKNTDVNSSPN